MDQETGRDLNPIVLVPKAEEDERNLRNPDRPSTLLDFSTATDEAEAGLVKRIQRLSSPEKWELKQMQAASCIDK